MQSISLTIDDATIKAEAGDNLLWVALDNGFSIPNLCALRGVTPPFASCRLCFVEIEGRSSPVTACTETVRDGMAVHLNTPRVKKLRSTAFELILSHHHLDCRNCAKNRSCDLQKIAYRFGLKLKPKRLRVIPRNLPVDSSHPLFIYDLNKCILCGKCVHVCHKQGTGMLDFAFRGMHTTVTTLAGIPLADTGCDSCLDCVVICPVGALVAKPEVSLVEAKAEVAHLI